ncbi:glycosyltransferase family 2 protein [Povalibacter sp.]|uniref:glycosyltransferase family 2 protein n=1 Tax=Povalibacter sp. TaxID=1962978 RepID=UPI002F3FCD91
MQSIESPAAPAISVVVLTYNRIESLTLLLGELSQLRYPGLEIIVVDNCSEVPAASLAATYPSVTFIRSPGNIGTGGRNIGMSRAAGEIVVCLDDDVTGLTDEALWKLGPMFQDPVIAGICFKVIEAVTGNITNWVHHKPVERFADATFATYEITEGAVAFRNQVAAAAGYYPESFFISHEGPDLAFRIMELGYDVVYNPAISVIHAYSPLARTSWRNYYFDTRNTLWLVARNTPFAFGCKLLIRQLGAMFIYSIRDGFFLWWLRGVRDGLCGWNKAMRERRKLSRATMKRIAEIDADRPSLAYLLRKRLFQRGIRI